MNLDNITAAPLKYFGGNVCMLFDLELPSQVTFNGLTLIRKAEFHSSLICVKRMLAELMQSRGGEADAWQQQILLDIETARQQSEPVFLGYKNELRHVVKEGNQTLIMKVDIGDLEPIFDYLRQRYPIDIPTQPTHITLSSPHSPQHSVSPSY